MIPRFFAGLALCAILPSLAPAQTASSWTSFKIGTLASYSNPFTVLPEGKFLYAENGEVYVQNTFGSAAKTLVEKGPLTFDPSFLAVRSNKEALLGKGGFAGPSGVHPFDPSTPVTAISSTALATLQNYNAVWWQHPTSGRSGWIFGGVNSIDSKHNLSFVSADGSFTGPLTTALSTYSAGLATDGLGNVYVGLSELFGAPDAAESEKVLKFTAAQIDAAVAGVITSTPATLTKAEATLVFKAISAASLAVDELGRIWAAGYLNASIELYDPTLARSYAITPQHSALANADGAPVYQVATFTRSGVGYVAALANDGFFSLGSDIAYTYAPAADFPVREVYATAPAVGFSEGAVTANVSFTISPAPNRSITVPVGFSGTAKPNVDYQAPKTVTFTAGQGTASLPITLLDDGLDEGADETIILTLGAAIPAQFATVLLGQNTVQVTINENDERPEVLPAQSFGTLRVGSPFMYDLQMDGGAAVKFSATGLPKGLTIDRSTGKITGTPQIPGESAQVVITVTNAAGTSTSVAFVLTVEDFPAAAKGQFIGLATRSAGSDQLGARLDLTVSATAAYSGSVTIGKKKYPIKGNLDTTPSNPTFTSSITHGGVARALTVNISEAGGSLSGTFADGAAWSGYHVSLSSQREGLHHFATAPGVGPTMPAGHGFGSLKISNLGKITVSGRTADNTAFTGSSCHDATGSVILYHALHKVVGSLFGTLAIDAGLDRAITGSLSWFKPPQAAGLYASGFNATTLAVTGGRYRPVAGSTMLLDTPAATLTLGSVFSGNVSFLPGTKLSIAAPTKLSINNATGAISGSVKLGSETIPFAGLVIPITGTASAFDGQGLGFFTRTSTGTSSIGALEITDVP